MQTTNIYEAKTKLSRLIDQVLSGEDVIISKAGKPLVKMIPYKESKACLPSRVLDCWRGQVTIADDFDELPADIAAYFRGEKW
ncbi:MAG: type II toxin-antitoxin system Phd/YefM family antitoxin [Holosporaceae bacterium]|jgi:prevent-host-death family protein|nr:type II toxin-antitoxin system Phd/YefM family antitoxin [Rhodospirillaceae bacterium]